MKTWIINFKEKITRLPKDASFEDFKHEILINEKLVIKNFFYKDKVVTNIEKGNIGVKIAENILKKQSGNVHILRNLKYNTILKLKNIINLKKWGGLSKWRRWTR